MGKLVSVLVPVYNAERYVSRLMQSLFGQTYGNVEYVFVDDGSTDGSVAAIERAVTASPLHAARTTIVTRPKNKGVAATRNTLLDNAHGDYILFVDSDDYISPDAVAKLVETAESTGADIVRQNYYELRGGGAEPLLRAFPPVTDRESALRALVAGSDMVDALWLLLVRRALVTTHRLRFPDNINVCEDWVMSVKLYFYSAKTVSVPEAYYYYDRGNAGSLTARRAFAHEEGMKAAVAVYNFLAGQGVMGTYKDAFCLRVLKWKQCLILSRDMLDVDRYINFYPASNTYWREIRYGRRERLLFWLAEHRAAALIKLLYKL